MSSGLPLERGGALLVLGSAGRIGRMLSEMDGGAWSVRGLGRADARAVLGGPGGGQPVVLCVRNDDLDAVLAMTHPSWRPDLVFVQNGMLRPWLDRAGLGGATQGALYVAVTTPGGAPVPGGDSVFSGRWAARVAGLMADHGVAARAVGPTELDRELSVKLGWILAFGLLGEVEQASVGELLDHRRPALDALVAELHPLLVAELGLDLGPGALLERLVGYSANIRHFPARLKERAWRTGWAAEAAAARGLSMPLHTALLQQVDAR